MIALFLGIKHIFQKSSGLSYNLCPSVCFLLYDPIFQILDTLVPCILVLGVAAINDNVAFFEKRDQLRDETVHGGASFHQHHDLPEQ